MKKSKTEYNFNGIHTSEELNTVARATDGLYANFHNAYELMRTVYEEAEGNSNVMFDTAMCLLLQVKVELDCMHGIRTNETEGFKRYYRGLFALDKR